MTGKRAWQAYRRLSQAAVEGAREQAEAGLRELAHRTGLEPALLSLCHNDLGVLLAARGETEEAREAFRQARALNEHNEAATANLARLTAPVPPRPARQEETEAPPGEAASAPPVPRAMPPKGRIAIVSLLFNWPSSGGGCMHTVGLGRALQAEGWEVRHIYAELPALGMGVVEGPPPLEGEVLRFGEAAPRAAELRRRFREAVDAFSPEVVVVTDAWSFKPHLAEAMQGYPVWLRFDGQECLCPLNNCRYLGGLPEHCRHHQLATPEECRGCLALRANLTSPLHQAERALSEVEAREYLPRLRRALGEAAAVLVNNPLFEAMLSPYAPHVRVVPPGVEAGRFSWRDEGGPARAPGEPARIFMAGVVAEPFKGYAVLHEACAALWERRRDFRLVVTGDQAGPVSEWCESTGWLSQEELPSYYRAADICVVPSLVQDAWPNVGSEATAAGRPLVASRIGGLPWMVGEEGTGLLFTPGDAGELANCLETLLEDPERRREMGRRGRERFLRTCSWEALLAQHYRPLLARLAAERAAPTGGEAR